MSRRRVPGWLPLAIGVFALVAADRADAQSGEWRRRGGGMATADVPAEVGAVPPPRYWYWETIGPDGTPIVYRPPNPLLTPVPVPIPPPAIGPALPPPNAPGSALNGLFPQGGPRADGAPRPKAPDPARAGQLTTYGDRLFRAGNLKRSAERYEQAIRADDRSAGPHVGLAQVALARGQYAESAAHFRKALEAQPDWLLNARDVQALYGEPADFARMIARIESHLQAHPDDRDAWFVLGAQWFLSGRTRKASDVFVRLADRKADPTLAAFLDAATPAPR